jgi:hypothetical protein
MVDLRKTNPANRINQGVTPKAVNAGRGNIPTQTEVQAQRDPEVKRQVELEAAIAKAEAEKAAAPPPAPYADPYSYENIQYNYNPQLMQQADRLNAPSLGFDRYRAQNEAAGAASSGYSSGLTSLASTSGLSAADKAAMAQQSQRARVTGGQRAQSGFNAMQAENLYNTEQFNIQNQQKVAGQNQSIMNQYEQDRAEFERKKAELIYQQKNEEARLNRALEASAKTAM